MKKKILHSILFSILLLIWNSTLQAQNFWQPTSGPFDYRVSAISINPTNGNIYAGTLGSGVYRSTNNGTSWTGMGSGVDSVISMTVDPKSGYIFVGNTFGLYRTTDNGANWVMLRNGLKGGLFLRLNSTSDGSIYASTSLGLFRSTDAGNNWKQLDSITYCFSVGVNSKNGQIYSGSLLGVKKCTDNGTTWVSSSNGMENHAAVCIGVNSNNGYIYAGTIYRVYRSTDNGSNWTAVKNGLDNSMVFALAVNSSNGYIFAGTFFGGLYCSTNNGETWIKINTVFKNPIALDISSNGTIFAGTELGVYQSSDNGNTWTITGAGIGNTAATILTMEINRKNGYLFAGTMAGVYRSTDNGKKWALSNDGLKNTFILNLACNQINGYLYSGYMLGIYRSTDDGVHWSKSWTGMQDSATIHSLAANPLNGNIFTSAGKKEALGMYHSTDNGTTWGKDNGYITTYYSMDAIAFNSKGYGFAINSSDFLRSTDNGLNWDRISSSTTPYGMSSIAINSKDEIIIGTYDGVYLSKDNGDTWAPISPSRFFSSPISSIVVNSKGFIYLSTGMTGISALTFNIPPQGVFYSANQGLNWTTINTGLGNMNVQKLILGSDGYLYAGTNSGVFKSSIPTTGIIRLPDTEPKVFNLSQNYPNPFNPSTTISFSLPKSGFVSLKVFNAIGAEIANLIGQEMNAGKYEYSWNATGVTSGLYFYVLQCGEFKDTKKLILIK